MGRAGKKRESGQIRDTRTHTVPYRRRAAFSAESKSIINQTNIKAAVWACIQWWLLRVVDAQTFLLCWCLHFLPVIRALADQNMAEITENNSVPFKAHQQPQWHSAQWTRAVSQVRNGHPATSLRLHLYMVPLHMSVCCHRLVCQLCLFNYWHHPDTNPTTHATASVGGPVAFNSSKPKVKTF